MGDLSIFDDEDIVSKLNPNKILVGLNMSVSGVVKKPFQNFHGPGGGAYKIRHALQGTSFWGAYMTDVIKDFPEKESGKMMSYLRTNKAFEKENKRKFLEEMKDLGSNNPTIIGFGNDVFNILQRNFNDQYRILKVPHYSAYTAKEKYREQVLQVIS